MTGILSSVTVANSSTAVMERTNETQTKLFIFKQFVLLRNYYKRDKRKDMLCKTNLKGLIPDFKD
jgi:hypothetical protein